jgi:hypothetical protein
MMKFLIPLFQQHNVITGPLLKQAFLSGNLEFFNSYLKEYPQLWSQMSVLEVNNIVWEIPRFEGVELLDLFASSELLSSATDFDGTAPFHLK